jgi:Mu-like prophage major head subunit gpT
MTAHSVGHETQARARGGVHCALAVPNDGSFIYANMSMVELARDCLRQSGLSYTGNPAAVLARALISMSDLPAIMGDSVNRTMRMAYEAAPSGLKRVARQTTARDFRMKHRIQMSAAPTLQPVNERVPGRSDRGPERDLRALHLRPADWFHPPGVRQDDLGALNDITRRMGIAAANFESQFLVNIVQRNALMADGYQHGNLAATGAALSSTSHSAARSAMRLQTEMSGQLINIVPKFILVPPALETLAEQVTTSIQAVETGNVNVFSFLNVLVEPRLTSSTKWWLADPTSIDGLEFSYLEGETGPQIQSEVGFEVDGIRFRIRLDYGGAFGEPRGWYQQPGA